MSWEGEHVEYVAHHIQKVYIRQTRVAMTPGSQRASSCVWNWWCVGRRANQKFMSFSTQHNLSCTLAPNGGDLSDEGLKTRHAGKMFSSSALMVVFRNMAERKLVYRAVLWSGLSKIFINTVCIVKSMTDDAVPADCAAEETPEENLLKSSAAVTLRALCHFYGRLPTVLLGRSLLHSSKHQAGQVTFPEGHIHLFISAAAFPKSASLTAGIYCFFIKGSLHSNNETFTLIYLWWNLVMQIASAGVHTN